jgi:Homeodomain-like domain
MHAKRKVDEALSLAAAGLPATRIAQRLGVPRSTVRDWVNGRVPAREGREFELRPEELPDVYVYLLGLYLGDGCLSALHRGVFRLRIVLDRRYPGIIEECRAAIAAVRPGAPVHVQHRRDSRADEVSAYWKAWPVLFPQHGAGRKHHRPIVLADWQEALVDAHPGLMLRGLIHSDGCRFENTGRGGWRHPRYSFSNRSADIRGIFCMACRRLGLHWTSAPYTIYVSRVADVALLDDFVGPKA